MAGLIEAEGLEWEKSKKFALIVGGFIGTLFSNVTSLRVCGSANYPSHYPSHNPTALTLDVQHDALQSCF